jgi:LPXTG-motif cell wall-anchored protein
MTEHTSGRRTVAAGLAAMAVGAIALIGAFPGAAGATGDPGGHRDSGPRHSGGDLPFEHPCPDEGYYFRWGHEPPRDQEAIPGTHDQDDAEIAAEGDFTVDIDNVRVEDGRKTFDFVTSVPVRLVFVMGNPRSDPSGRAYDYEPAVTEGSDLASGDQWVKNVVFCPAEETPPSTEPPSTEPPSTEPPSTEPPSTEPPSTEPPSTEPPSTEPTTPSTEPPSTEAPTTAPPSTQPVADQGEQLPQTGSTTMPLVAGAGALVAVGVAAVVGRRYLQQRATS